MVLDTAAELFATHGVSKTSTNRIAAEAGISIGTVYRYFPDRSAIVDELLNRMLDDLERGFDAVRPTVVADLSDETRPPEDRYSAAMHRILTVFNSALVENAGLVRAFVSTVQFYASNLPQFEKRLHAMLAQILQLGTGDDETTETICMVVVNTAFAVVVRTAVSNDADSDCIDELGMACRMLGLWLARTMITDSVSRAQ
ncbi:TetR/AcrR family transcriptional regulator [Nocardia sp. NPDC050378]|uniref:TetR/AcrR family transcriptional regulator n=1 Tax=Nocardia sp. NPDC050378 TaxID=3155400 RepID=UPI0033FB5DC3